MTGQRSLASRARTAAVLAVIGLAGCGGASVAGDVNTPSQTPPNTGPGGATRAPATTGAPATSAVVEPAGTTVATTGPGESLPAIVALLPPPDGTGPVATDAVRVPANPSRPVGVPLQPGERGPGSCTLSVIGDSITVGGAENLFTALWASGCDVMGIAAKVGAGTGYGLRLAQDLDTQQRLAPVVLAELGVNDCVGSDAAIDAGIDAFMRFMGSGRLVIWPTTNIARATPYCSETDDERVNSRIGAAAARWKNMRVIDWWDIARQHPEWFPDGLHLDAEGRRVWALWLAEGVAQATRTGK
ncbi:MAG TPA: GDSL-type esterase/lipase family protein [Acidimicrobiales bacterium]